MPGRLKLKNYIQKANTLCRHLQHSRRLHMSGHTTASHTFHGLAYSACKCWQNTGIVLHGAYLPSYWILMYLPGMPASSSLVAAPAQLPKLNYAVPHRTRPCRCQSGACRQLHTGNLRRRIPLGAPARNCILTCFPCLTTYHLLFGATCRTLGPCHTLGPSASAYLPHLRVTDAMLVI